jgi:hypothetical protein
MEITAKVYGMKIGELSETKKGNIVREKIDDGETYSDTETCREA